jgi:hypothetical protein
MIKGEILITQLRTKIVVSDDKISQLIPRRKSDQTFNYFSKSNELIVSSLKRNIEMTKKDLQPL